MPSALWVSSGNTDMNNTGNYNAVWDSTYDLVFSGASSTNAIATSNLVVNSITITSGHTAQWNITGYTATVVSGLSHNCGGASNLGNGITLSGTSGNLYIGASTGSITMSNCVITASASGCVAECNQIWFPKKFIVSNNCGLTIQGSNINGGFANQTFLTIGTSASLKVDCNITFYQNANVQTVTQGDSSTFNGAGNITIKPYGANSYLSAIKYTGTGDWYVLSTGSNAGDFILQGAFDIADNDLYVYQSAAVALTMSFNTGNNNITCGKMFLGANAFAISGSSFTVNCGSSTINCTEYNSASYNSSISTQTINLGSSVINCSGNWTYGSNHNIYPGTSVLNIQNTSTITPNGKYFYDFNVNAPALTATLGGSITTISGGDLTITAGTLNIDGYTVSCNGDLSVNGTSTISGTNSVLNVSGNFTTAAGSTFTITSGAVLNMFGATSAISTGGKSYPTTNIYGDCSITGGCTFRSLVWGTDGKQITFQAGQTYTITTLQASDWNGSAGNLNKLVSSTPTSTYTIAIPSSINTSYMNPTDCVLSGGTIEVTNGLNGGNNTGWTFITPITKTDLNLGLVLGLDTKVGIRVVVGY